MPDECVAEMFITYGKVELEQTNAKVRRCTEEHVVVVDTVCG